MSYDNLDKMTIKLQSYILSTTTETLSPFRAVQHSNSFNRTSFQQQLKLKAELVSNITKISFNRTSFQQQLKPEINAKHTTQCRSFNRTSFQQQLKQDRKYYSVL